MTQDSSRQLRARRASLVGAAALLVILTAAPPARGAALTHAKAVHVPGSTSPGIHISDGASDAIAEFLIGGPRHWATTDAPKFPKGLLIANKNGTLRDTPVTEFLVWMHARHPIAFDRRHPNIAPLFKTTSATQIKAHQLAQVVSSPSHTASFQVLVRPKSASSTGTTVKAGTSTTPAAQVFAQPVPEPASALSTLALFGGAGLWWVRRKRRTFV